MSCSDPKLMLLLKNFCGITNLTWNKIMIRIWMSQNLSLTNTCLGEFNMGLKPFASIHEWKNRGKNNPLNMINNNWKMSFIFSPYLVISWDKEYGSNQHQNDTQPPSNFQFLVSKLIYPSEFHWLPWNFTWEDTSLWIVPMNLRPSQLKK